jgi:hypothetical protein
MLCSTFHSLHHWRASGGSLLGSCVIVLPPSHMISGWKLKTLNCLVPLTIARDRGVVMELQFLRSRRTTIGGHVHVLNHYTLAFDVWCSRWPPIIYIWLSCFRPQYSLSAGEIDAPWPGVRGLTALSDDSLVCPRWWFPVVHKET